MARFFGELESATCTRRIEVPATVGFPERAPFVASFRPGGSEPVTTDQVSAPLPPLAFSVVLVMALPGVPFGSEVVRTVIGAIVMVNWRVAMFFGTLPSATWTVKVEVPAAVGVPDRAPGGAELETGGQGAGGHRPDQRRLPAVGGEPRGRVGLADQARGRDERDDGDRVDGDGELAGGDVLGHAAVGDLDGEGGGSGRRRGAGQGAGGAELEAGREGAGGPSRPGSPSRRWR